MNFIFTACDCHGVGALDNFCDVVTGQCKCDEKAYGRRCNECEPGYWNFPNCEACKFCNLFLDHKDVI